MNTFVESQFEVMYFMNFKQKRIRMKTFVESQFEIMPVYELQTKANYYEDNC